MVGVFTEDVFVCILAVVAVVVVLVVLVVVMYQVRVRSLFAFERGMREEG